MLSPRAIHAFSPHRCCLSCLCLSSHDQTETWKDLAVGASKHADNDVEAVRVEDLANGDVGGDVRAVNVLLVPLRGDGGSAMFQCFSHSRGGRCLCVEGGRGRGGDRKLTVHWGSLSLGGL